MISFPSRKRNSVFDKKQSATVVERGNSLSDRAHFKKRREVPVAVWDAVLRSEE